MASVSVSGLTTLHDGTTAGSATSSNLLTAMSVSQGTRSTQTLIATDRASSGWRTEDSSGAGEYASRWTTSGDKDLSAGDMLVISNFTCQVFAGGLNDVNTIANRGVAFYIGDDSASTFRRWVMGGIDQTHIDAMGYGVATVVSPANTSDAVDESGTAPTLSTIDDIGLTFNTLGGGQRLAVSWCGYTTGIVLVGGDGASTDGTFGDFYDYTDGSPGSDTTNLPIKVIAEEGGGAVYNVSIPLIIGDGGSNATEFSVITATTVLFRQNSDVQANYPPLNILPNIIGLRVNAGTSDVVTINNVSFQSVSPWYLKFAGTPTADIDFANNTIQGAGKIDVVDDLDLTSCTFNSCGAITAGSTTITSTSYKNIRDCYHLILDSVVNTSGLTFSSYPEKADLTGLGTSNVDDTNDIITVTDHGYPRGSVQMVTYDNGGGSDLAGLTDGTDYFIYIQDSDDFQVYASYANAKAQMSALDLTTAGSGTSHSFSPKAYAMVIETAGTYQLTNPSFDDSGTQDIYVSASSSTVALQILGNTNTPTYDTEGATVTITFPRDLTIDSLQTGSNVRMEKVSDSSLVSEGAESGGSYTDSYNYTANLNIKNIVRKYGYKTYEFTGTITSSGFSASAAQVAENFVVVNEATALAYTGITEDFSARTVSLSESHTIQEIFDYLNAEAAVLSVLDEDIMISTVGGVDISLESCDLTVASGGTLTSTTQTLVSNGSDIAVNTGGSVTADIKIDSGSKLTTADIDLVTGIVSLTGTGDWEIEAAGTAPSGSAGASATIEVTTANASDVFDFSAFTFNSATVFENSSGNNIFLNIAPGATAPTTLETSGTITITEQATVTAPNLIDDTKVELYNVTKTVVLDYSTVSGGSGYSYTADFQDADLALNDTLQLRAAYQSGATAKQLIEATQVITATGASFLDEQENMPVYNAYGQDGSLMDDANGGEFLWDEAPDLQVDVEDADNRTYVPRFGAWYYYFCTTETGIRELFGAFNWYSQGNLEIDVSKVDVAIDNVKSAALSILGGQIYRTDGATPVAAGSNTIYFYNSEQADLNAVKSKTDSLTFSVAGQVDSNIKSVNDLTVDGAGTEADPWGPA